MDELSVLGFEKYKLSEISVRNQIELFANAECVVGPHGAGLTNTVFTNSCKLFEIFSGQFYESYFYRMCNQLGFSYDYYIANNEPMRGDMEVNAEEIQRQVTELLS
jgi:capsular polysaccharide biosynthesis protein